MIYLYYTGAKIADGPQQDIQKSIGGYISSSVIPNARINGLFSDISLLGQENNLPQTICIAVKNIANEDLNDFTLFADLSTDPPLYEITAAFLKPTLDDCDGLFLEQLPSMNDQPYYGTFHDILKATNAVNTGILKKGEYLGIFITRKILSTDSGCTAVDFSNLSEDQLSETVSLKFSWT